MLLGSAFSGSREYSAVHFAAAAHVVAPLFALYIALWRWAPDEPLGRALRLGRPAGREWARALLGVIAGIAAVWPAYALLLWGHSVIEGVVVPPEVIAAQNAALADPAIMWLVRVAGALAIPLAMELLFRGFVQPRLAPSVGRWTAMAMTLALLVLVQLDARSAPAALAGALVVGLVRAVSLGVWPAIAGAVAHESTAVLMDIWRYAPRTDLWPVAAGSAVAALTLGAVLAVSPRDAVKAS